MAAQCQESLPALRRGRHVDSVAFATGRSWEWFLWCSVSTLLQASAAMSTFKALA